MPHQLQWSIGWKRIKSQKTMYDGTSQNSLY